MTGPVVVASQFEVWGETWTELGPRWGGQVLLAAAVVIALAKTVRRMSVKAAIGALVALVLCLGVYAARYGIQALVDDEVAHPGGAGPVPALVDGGGR